MESPLRATEINLRGSVARKGLKRYWDQLSRGSVRCAHYTPSLWSAALRATHSVWKWASINLLWTHWLFFNRVDNAAFSSFAGCFLVEYQHSYDL